MNDEHFSKFLFLKLKTEPDYNPYCGRCDGLVRMQRKEYGHWTHWCGATHDAREDLAELAAKEAAPVGITGEPGHG